MSFRQEGISYGSEIQQKTDSSKSSCLQFAMNNTQNNLFLTYKTGVQSTNILKEQMQFDGGIPT